ncbi:MAG: hypothetical protein AB7E36_09605 [Salinivirgaceae bacterium]
MFLVALTDNQPSLEDFKKFEISSNLIHKFANIYWQELPNEIIDGKEIGFVEKEITRLKENFKAVIKEMEIDYIKNVFPVRFPEQQFNDLIKKDKCYYCGLTLMEIEELGAKHLLSKKNLRGWSLEIDRKTANLEYTPDNCVMACYWCNNAKTDEFNADEFKPIAEKIKNAFDERLKKATKN